MKDLNQLNNQMSAHSNLMCNKTLNGFRQTLNTLFQIILFSAFMQTLVKKVDYQLNVNNSHKTQQSVDQQEKNNDT